MQIFTFDINLEENELNEFLEVNERSIKDINFLDGKAIVTFNQPFELTRHIELQIEEAQEHLKKKEYELDVLKSYTHIDKEKIESTLEGVESDIKTLKAKIKTSNEWLKKTSSKK